MERFFHILLIHSVKDLFKYKSFFFLVFVLILADRGLKWLTRNQRIDFDTARLKQLGLNAAHYAFEQLPTLVANLLTDYRTFAVVAAMFFLKQLISMWPSSDMRRMHRAERERFGLVASLLSIRGRQIAWDAVAVGTIVALMLLWTTGWYLLARWGWQQTRTAAWLMIWAGSAGLCLPMVMAGSSYSSKIAVLSQGSFSAKLRLFFKLFSDHKIAAASWLFYSARLVVEVLFVVALPALVLILIDAFWLRLVLAALLATPVYSFLKMASFKFFLYIYEPFPLVRTEYRDHYHSNAWQHRNTARTIGCQPDSPQTTH